MARKKTEKGKRPIESYEHKDKERLNNPPVGLVTPQTDPDAGQRRKTYAYDPHIDPQLQWSGKAEHTSFEMPTVSLHVHERIDPHTIIEAVRKINDYGLEQTSFFSMPEMNLPMRQAIEFYKHAHGWSNRLVAGDSLLVMNSLLEKEGMAGKVQMIYIDPPYGIKYGSNFQPFINKRDVKDGKDEDLTSEPEQIRAFRDTWELGIHSYLTYLRDRLLLARDLLTESGSIFVQISDENVHHVRELMDEVFGAGNFVAIIPFRKKTMPLGAKFIESMYDYLLWYGKDKGITKYHVLYEPQRVEGEFHWSWYELPDRTRVKMTKDQVLHHSLVPENARIFRLVSMWPASFSEAAVFDVEFNGQLIKPPKGQCWPTNEQGMKNISASGRVNMEGRHLRRIVYLDEYSHTKIVGLWSDTTGARDQNYVVETSPKVIERCLLMTTDPGDLVFDPTCGSGTTAFVAEQWGRRWITCDTSRVALTLAKQRLMTAVFDYYELAHPLEGVCSGFIYKTVPHVTLKSIANNEPPGTETLYDQPQVDRKRMRVSGPFTVEAVPAPSVKSVGEIISDAPKKADSSIARSGGTLRQSEWRDELLKTGIRGKAGQYIRFARLEPLPGCRWLHVDGETLQTDEGADSVREDVASFKSRRAVVSFGPEHAPLEQRQVEHAWEEARTLVPKPGLLIFAAFQFDPEASKDIDEMKTELAGMQFLKVQMNADLLTDDLKKKRASNESFWLIGQPDVEIRKVNVESKPKKYKQSKKTEKEEKEPGTVQYKVIVHGFDYYNTKTGNIESGGSDKIAIWLLDTDYDGRSLFPRQVFFPIAGENEGWAKLAKNLKAEIDLDLIEAYRGTESLPFAPGKHKRIAVKIVDDRGIESLKIMEVVE